MEFFKAEKISDSTIGIADLTRVYSYLVIGKERAVLLDSGTGLGNIYEYARTLTDKPLFCILTHGHVDHAGGAAYFKEIYLNEADWTTVKGAAGLSYRKQYILSSIKPGTEKLISENDYAPDREDGYLALNDQQEFDLGGITLKALKLAGHTQGMTTILNKEEGSILLGDGCNSSTFIWLKESTTIEEYWENLKDFKKYDSLYDKAYISHVNPYTKKGIIDSAIECCQEIMDGKDDAISFNFAGYQAKLAKKTLAHMIREDGGLANIVYDPNRIFKKQS